MLARLMALLERGDFQPYLQRPALKMAMMTLRAPQSRHQTIHRGIALWIRCVPPGGSGHNSRGHCSKFLMGSIQERVNLASPNGETTCQASYWSHGATIHAICAFAMRVESASQPGPEIAKLSYDGKWKVRTGPGFLDTRCLTPPKLCTRSPAKLCARTAERMLYF